MKKYGEITSIQGYAAKRLPRLGKIRTGVKLTKTRDDGTEVEYPDEVDYFVCPPEVQKAFGEQPKMLWFYFPVDEVGLVAPHAYKKYGAAGLVCKGNGVSYVRDEGGCISEGMCPRPDECDFAKRLKTNRKGEEQVVIECKAIMNLQVVIYRVNAGGIYQIDTSSWNAITNVLNVLAVVRNLFGQIRMIPLKLVRKPKETKFEGMKSLHWPIDIEVPTMEEMETELPHALRFRRLVAMIGKRALGMTQQPDEAVTVAPPSEKEIEADLYPKDVVKQVVKTGGTTGDPSRDKEIVVDVKTGEVLGGDDGTPFGPPAALPAATPAAPKVQTPDETEAVVAKSSDKLKALFAHKKKAKNDAPAAAPTPAPEPEKPPASPPVVPPQAPVATAQGDDWANLKVEELF